MTCVVAMWLALNVLFLLCRVISVYGPRFKATPISELIFARLIYVRRTKGNSFDSAWIDAIETTGRYDWYEPLRGRRHTET
jgi:hypothetical protein